MGDFDSLFEGALQPATRGIQMSTAIIELLCHLVAGEVVDGTQAHPDDLVFLSILAEGYRELQTLDLLGDVDQSFGIALDKIETFLLILGNGVE